MLVVISDLHLIDGTAAAHNVSPAAFESVLFSHIVALARHKGARELTLVLLGDILDPIRTTRWFEDAGVPVPLDERPWGSGGVADAVAPRPGSPTEARSLAILGALPADGRRESVPRDTILYQNWDTLAFLRELPASLRAELGRDLPVEVVFVPGNHDRLAWVYDGVRDRVRALLGATIAPHTVIGDPEGQWAFPTAFHAPRYGLLCRHGHQHDPWNFLGAAPDDIAGHRHPTLGEVFAAEFVVRLPMAMAARRAEVPAITDAVLAGLREVDNLRPASAVGPWLADQMIHDLDGAARRAFDDVLRSVVRELVALDLPDALSRQAGGWQRLRTLLRRDWFGPMALASLPSLARLQLLPRAIGHRGRGATSMEAFARAAWQEPALRDARAARFVAYGHTHVPAVLPLGELRGEEAVYVNTGTWRDRIFPSPLRGDAKRFVQVRQLTFAAFFLPEEDARDKQPGTLSFEVWTGNKKKAYVGGVVAGA